MTTASGDEYVSASEAARMLGISPQRVAQLVDRGKLPAVRPWPRAVRIPRAAVEQRIESMKENP